MTVYKVRRRPNETARAWRLRVRRAIGYVLTATGGGAVGIGTGIGLPDLAITGGCVVLLGLGVAVQWRAD